METRYLSYNEILDVYREQATTFGGFCAIRDNNALLSIVANPRREFAGRELYPDIQTKVSILVFSIVKNHPFVDGNKRTAYVCGVLFLRLNNYDLICEHERFKDLVLNIAANKATLDDVKDWFAIHITKKDKNKSKINRSTRNEA